MGVIADKPSGLVSVVIPCFKQAGYLANAIWSALSQSCSAVEVVVVDDGSPDETGAIAASFGSQIRYVRQNNGGLAAARNSGTLEAMGEFVIFLDADDLLPIHAVAHHLAAMTSSEGATATCGGWVEVNPQGVILREAPPPTFEPDPFHALLRRNLAPCHAFLIRRDAVLSAGLFDVELRSHEDWDLWLRIAAQGGCFVPTPAVVAQYVRYTGSMSGNTRRMLETGYRVLGKAHQQHRDCRLCDHSLADAHRTLAREFLVGLARRSLSLSDARAVYCNACRNDQRGLRHLAFAAFGLAAGVTTRALKG